MRQHITVHAEVKIAPATQSQVTSAIGEAVHAQVCGCTRHYYRCTMWRRTIAPQLLAIHRALDAAGLAIIHTGGTP